MGSPWGHSQDYRRLRPAERAAWFLAASLWTIVIGEVNLRRVIAENPLNDVRNSRSTVGGLTIWSPDNTYYLPPAQNLLDGHGFIIERDQEQTRVRRVPGYSLFYGLHLLAFGAEGAHRFVRYTQVGLHALAAVLLGAAVFRLTSDLAWARATTALYGFSPFAAVYAYFTITESIYPAMAAISVYLLAVALGTRSMLACSILGVWLGALALTRAPTGLFLPSALMVLVLAGRASGEGLDDLGRRVVPVLVGFLLVLLPWTVRNYLVTGGRLIPLEATDDTVQYGQAVEGLRRWWTSWSVEDWTPIQYQIDITALVAEGRHDEAAKRAQELAEGLPERALAGINRQAVARLFEELPACLDAKIRASTLPGPPRDRLMARVATPHACDAALAERFDALAQGFKRADPFAFYISTPLGRARTLTIHSNSSAFGSLNPEGRALSRAETLVKGGLFALNCSLFAGWLAFLAVGRPRIVRWMAALFPVATLVFLCWFWRIRIENRYLLAAHPLFSMACAFFLASLWRLAQPTSSKRHSPMERASLPETVSPASGKRAPAS